MLANARTIQDEIDVLIRRCSDSVLDDAKHDSFVDLVTDDSTTPPFLRETVTSHEVKILSMKETRKPAKDTAELYKYYDEYYSTHGRLPEREEDAPLRGRKASEHNVLSEEFIRRYPFMSALFDFSSFCFYNLFIVPTQRVMVYVFGEQYLKHSSSVTGHIRTFLTDWQLAWNEKCSSATVKVHPHSPVTESNLIQQEEEMEYNRSLQTEADAANDTPLVDIDANSAIHPAANPSSQFGAQTAIERYAQATHSAPTTPSQNSSSITEQVVSKQKNRTLTFVQNMERIDLRFVAKYAFAAWLGMTAALTILQSFGVSVL